jgi:NADPH-dependent curcumin reductase CurA
MVSNKSLVFSRPSSSGLLVAGEHLTVEDRGFDPNSKPPSGGFTAEVIDVSLDPYLRHLLVDEESARHGFEPVKIGNVIHNDALLRILSIDGADPVAEPGDLVLGPSPISEYAIIGKEEAKQFQKIQNPFDLDPKFFLGALGMPGLTAYSAFYQIGQPKSGETIFISAASGAVGQMVGHLAKREGLTVIGSVGSDEKLAVLKEQLGFDLGFNYKNGDLLRQLQTLAPQGIDSKQLE